MMKYTNIFLYHVGIINLFLTLRHSLYLNAIHQIVFALVNKSNITMVGMEVRTCQRSVFGGNPTRKSSSVSAGETQDYSLFRSRKTPRSRGRYAAPVAMQLQTYKISSIKINV